MSILVLNPPLGGSRFLTRKRAEKLVADRNARWNANKTGIWFKRTPATIEHFRKQAESNEGSSVEWRPKDSAGTTVMQLVAR